MPFGTCQNSSTEQQTGNDGGGWQETEDATNEDRKTDIFCSISLSIWMLLIWVIMQPYVFFICNTYLSGGQLGHAFD